MAFIANLMNLSKMVKPYTISAVVCNQHSDMRDEKRASDIRMKERDAALVHTIYNNSAEVFSV